MTDCTDPGDLGAVYRSAILICAGLLEAFAAKAQGREGMRKEGTA